MVAVLTGCTLNKDEIKAWIGYKYPGSVEIGSFEDFAESALVIHVLCQSDKVIVIETNANVSTSDSIVEQLALPADRISCK